MPKYYVDSGDLQHICDAPNQIMALSDAIEKFQGGGLGQVVRVNEQGFELEHDDDTYFDTLMLLDELGVDLD